MAKGTYLDSLVLKDCLSCSTKGSVAEVFLMGTTLSFDFVSRSPLSRKDPGTGCRTTKKAAAYLIELLKIGLDDCWLRW